MFGIQQIQKEIFRGFKQYGKKKEKVNKIDVTAEKLLQSFIKRKCSMQNANIIGEIRRVFRILRKNSCVIK